jgi:hypothetical protein
VRLICELSSIVEQKVLKFLENNIRIKMNDKMSKPDDGLLRFVPVRGCTADFGNNFFS